MSKKEKAAGKGNSQAAKNNENHSSSIIAFDAGNVKADAVKKLKSEDKAAKYDRYGSIMHTAVRDALCEFCRQNEEFSRAIIQTDKPPEVKAFEREYQNYLEVLKHDKQNQRSA